MAWHKINFRSKVKSSTVLEVVVSMVIIILVFGISMMIYSNVMRLSLSPQKIKAQAILEKALAQAEQEIAPVNKTVIIGDIGIEEEVKPYPENTNLSDIHLAAYDINKQKITELEKVIITK